MASPLACSLILPPATWSRVRQSKPGPVRIAAIETSNVPLTRGARASATKLAKIVAATQSMVGRSGRSIRRPSAEANEFERDRRRDDAARIGGRLQLRRFERHPLGRERREAISLRRIGRLRRCGAGRARRGQFGAVFAAAAAPPFPHASVARPRRHCAANHRREASARGAGRAPLRTSDGRRGCVARIWPSARRFRWPLSRRRSTSLWRAACGTISRLPGSAQTWGEAARTQNARFDLAARAGADARGVRCWPNQKILRRRR